jgi:hypothetical protein
LHVFIDESGTFTGYHDCSVSVVGALAIPNGKLGTIRTKYARLRTQLPTKNGEVKGSLLNEQQVDAVIALLARNDAIFEITALDLGFHKETDLVVRKKQHADEMQARSIRFRPPHDALVKQTGHDIESISLPLYLQAITTFYTLQNIIHHVPLYFAQRQPRELATFTWVVDGKDPVKKTRWEKWWPWYASGALASMSKRRPAPVMEGADYSFYDRFHGSDGASEGIDLSLLLADLRFSSAVEPELELVDIVVNATRRALIGNLKEAGWRRIPTLMVHRREPYIQFMMLAETPDQIRHPAYGRLVNQFFSRDGRSMVAPRFLRSIAAEEGVG